MGGFLSLRLIPLSHPLHSSIRSFPTTPHLRSSFPVIHLYLLEKRSITWERRGSLPSVTHFFVPSSLLCLSPSLPPLSLFAFMAWELGAGAKRALPPVFLSHIPTTQTRDRKWWGERKMARLSSLFPVFSLRSLHSLPSIDRNRETGR